MPWEVRECAQHKLVFPASALTCPWRVGLDSGCSMSEPFVVERLDLEGPGQARSTDTETAKAAGAITIRRGTQRWKVLQAIERAGDYGATSWELVEATSIPYTSLTPRVGELKHGGFVVATDRRRLSSSGVQQEVLVVKAAATPGVAVDAEAGDPWENEDVVYE